MNVERRRAATDPQTNPNDLYAVSPSVGCQSLHPPSSFIIIIINQPESLYPFYNPTYGG